jgi:hypothetical protein
MEPDKVEVYLRDGQVDHVLVHIPRSGEDGWGSWQWFDAGRYAGLFPQVRVFEADVLVVPEKGGYDQEWTEVT